MPRLLTDRRNDLRVQLRLQAAFERRLQQAMRGELVDVAERAARQIADTGNFDVGLQQHEQRVRAELEASYNAVMPEFGQRILDAASDKRFAAVEVKQGEAEFDRAMREWIRRVSTLKVAQITETTREQLRRKLEAGRREGLSTDEIARSMRDDLGGAVAATRAAVIGRTEVHAAAQAANQQAADATGVQGLRKEWMAAEDSRTRPDHDAADGQVVDKDGEFTVGGVRMKAPGDADAPAAQVVNCRCALTFITPGGE